MNQKVASKLAGSVRQAKENQTSANKTEVEKKPVAVRAVKDDTPVAALQPSRRIWPD